jgi:hypothetical protein
MTHHFICNHCKHENTVSISESDRGSYQMQKGEFKETTCTRCLRKETTHINDIYGKVSKKMLIGGFITGLLLTIILLFVHPNIIIISSAIISIPIMVFIYENNLVRTFNNYRIRKK